MCEKENMCVKESVWPDGYIVYQSMVVFIIENLHSSIKMAKVGTNVADYQTKTIPKMSQKQLKFCQSGEF